MSEITIFVEENGQKMPLTVPLGINLSLMEVLKGYDYPIEAACGGMALCATCHIEILETSLESLKTATSDDELDMLDTLPIVTASSRLSCQIRIAAQLDGLVLKLA